MWSSSLTWSQAQAEADLGILIVVNHGAAGCYLYERPFLLGCAPLLVTGYVHQGEFGVSSPTLKRYLLWTCPRELTPAAHSRMIFKDEARQQKAPGIMTSAANHVDQPWIVYGCQGGGDRWPLKVDTNPMISTKKHHHISILRQWSHEHRCNCDCRANLTWDAFASRQRTKTLVEYYSRDY